MALLRYAAALILVLLAQAALAQVPESAVEAAFLLKFGAYVDWPPGTFRSPHSAVVIGVAGDTAVADELAAMSGHRTVAGRPVRVVRIGEGEPVPDVQVLFIGRGAPADSLLGAVAGRPVLVVTDDPFSLPPGAVLNFVVGDRVRFEASLRAAENRRLKLGAPLLSVAVRIDGKPR